MQTGECFKPDKVWRDMWPRRKPSGQERCWKRRWESRLRTAAWSGATENAGANPIESNRAVDHDRSSSSFMSHSPLPATSIFGHEIRVPTTKGPGRCHLSSIETLSLAEKIRPSHQPRLSSGPLVLFLQ